jgi:hypothetical protein
MTFVNQRSISAIMFRFVHMCLPLAIGHWPLAIGHLPFQLPPERLGAGGKIGGVVLADIAQTDEAETDVGHGRSLAEGRRVRQM